MTRDIATLPDEARQNPIVFLDQLSTSVGGLVDIEAVRKRLALVAAAEAWARQYGKQSEPILRHTLATRLLHERRLGELLDGNTEIIRDDFGKLQGRNRLPSGLTLNSSMYAQTLARTPRAWFDGLVKAIRDGTRRYAIKEIYLQAQRAAIQVASSEQGQAQSKAMEESEEPTDEDKAKAEVDSKSKDETTSESKGTSDSEDQQPQDKSIDTNKNQILEDDFRLAASDFPGECVSLVFTDPPYGRETLALYPALANFASKVLLPGGSLLVYAPHYALPQVMQSMAGILRYFWTFVVLHGGTKALMREFGIRVHYKPILWYVKRDRYNKQNIMSDVIQSSPEKTDHEWQQSIVEAKHLIENLTEANDLVVDPLAGSGTTLIATGQCNRRWIGIEKDHKTAELAKQRLHKLGLLEKV